MQELSTFTKMFPLTKCNINVLESQHESDGESVEGAKYHPNLFLPPRGWQRDLLTSKILELVISDKYSKFQWKHPLKSKAGQELSE